jgi:hypothetical protein
MKKKELEEDTITPPPPSDILLTQNWLQVLQVLVEVVVFTGLLMILLCGTA